MCAKNKLSLKFSRFTVNVYVKPDEVEIIMKAKKTGLKRKGLKPDVMASPRFSYVTILGFFLRGYVKDAVYVLPLSQSIKELKDWICAAI